MRAVLEPALTSPNLLTKQPRARVDIDAERDGRPWEVISSNRVQLSWRLSGLYNVRN